jgi:predicted RNA binding protein YcfA (HicA-like mRNA interferase family)
MSRNPRITGAELIDALGRAGFVTARIRGSHHFLRHEDGRRTVVPLHSGEIIGPGLLSKILRDCQVSGDDISKLLRRE